MWQMPNARRMPRRRQGAGQTDCTPRAEVGVVRILNPASRTKAALRQAYATALTFRIGPPCGPGDLIPACGPRRCGKAAKEEVYHGKSRQSSR